MVVSRRELSVSFMIKRRWIIGYIMADIVCVGLGMGVPFFNILLGFPTGWLLSHKLTDQRKVFKYLLLAALFTFFVLATIWLSAMLPYYFDPTKSVANFGEPLILFSPMASFWGWLVLMVVISPLLQLLLSVFAAYLTSIEKRN